VWPGDGEKPREGQLVRLRWNVAKHPAALQENVCGPIKNNYFADMSSGSEEGSYLRLIDLCITQL